MKIDNINLKTDCFFKKTNSALILVDSDGQILCP